MNENKSVTPAPSGVSRRTVVKGAAWAVPAIAVASSVPAMAASQPVIIDWGSSEACKFAGGSFASKFCYKFGYVLFATFESSINTTVTINSMEVGGVPQCIVGVAYQSACATALPSNTFSVTAGVPVAVAIYSNAAGDSSSDLVEVTFTISGGGTVTDDSTGFDMVGNPWQGSCPRPAGCTDPISACGTPCDLTVGG